MTTIFAVSSGRPPAAIAVIRVSGSEALASAAALAGRLPQPRRAGLRMLKTADGRPLDRALVLIFPGPHSATGEDLVELHCHGGRAVVAAVQAALAALPGCHAAEPGEFTRRALTNCRIDLTEAEGLADLLEAETEAQRVSALGAAEGQVSRAVGGWLAEVAILSARIEAVLDHADESDVDAGDAEVAAIGVATRRLGREIAEVADQPPVERLRDGVRVVIAGPPNAGKSTLLNLLAARDAAIVSPVPGTTRDRIEASVSRGGDAYTLVDTAGLRPTEDAVERVGVELATIAVNEADLLVWLGDSPPPRSDALWVQAQADAPGRTTLLPGRHLLVSRDRPDLVAMLWAEIAQRSRALMPRSDALPLRERHRGLCREAAEELQRAMDDPVLVGEHLRRGRQLLARITGVDATELMLNELFGRFCLGK